MAYIDTYMYIKYIHIYVPTHTHTHTHAHTLAGWLAGWPKPLALWQWTIYSCFINVYMQADRQTDGQADVRTRIFGAYIPYTDRYW